MTARAALVVSLSLAIGPLSAVSAGGFADRASCVVQGYVYANPGEPSTFERVDLCTDVKAEVLDGALLHMYSRSNWVDIVLPSTGGYQRFVYRWCSPVAHVGPETWPVAYGPLKSG